MKTKHQQPALSLTNPLCTTLFAVTVLVLLTSAIAHADNIYVSCFFGGTIEKFDSSGNMSTFASGLGYPEGLAFDSSDNLYASTEGSAQGSGTIEKFDSSGNRSTFATGLQSPAGLAFDSGGNLYAANYWSGTIEKFDSSGNGFTFASGLNYPNFIAMQVPEPATLLLLTLGGLFLRKR